MTHITIADSQYGYLEKEFWLLQFTSSDGNKVIPLLSPSMYLQDTPLLSPGIIG